MFILFNLFFIYSLVDDAILLLKLLFAFFLVQKKLLNNKPHR